MDCINTLACWVKKEPNDLRWTLREEEEKEGDGRHRGSICANLTSVVFY